MPDIQEEEKKILARLFAEAKKVKMQVDSATQNPQDLINLYNVYYKKYLDNQKKSQPILLTALLKIQKNTSLNTRDIIELHRNFGIRFDRNGTITKISENAPILKVTKILMGLLLTSPGLYEHYQLLGAQLPTKEQLQSIKQNPTIELLTPIISNILKATIMVPNDIIKELKYPALPIPSLLEELQQLLVAEHKNYEKINLLFQKLYNELGIKCFITSKGVTLQKIKFNSPIFSANWEDKRYNIHFNNKMLYATRTSNIPLNTSETKVLGMGAFGKAVRATGYNLEDPSNTLRKLVSKKIIIKDTKSIVKEMGALKKLKVGGAIKRTISKSNPGEQLAHIIMDFYEGKPLNSKDSLNLGLSDRIKLMQQLVKQIVKTHNAGIRHNDLKGDNIIVNYPQLSVGLTDFGITDTIDPKMLHEVGTETKGTPIYVAPEMINQEILQTLRTSNPNLELSTYFASDIYSLGKVLIYDAGLHTLGIAYRMTDADPTKRPTLDEISTALGKYKEHAASIAQLEKTIEEITKLSTKVDFICELYKNHDICSEQYYKTLMQVLESGNPEDLSKMQTIPMFNHLFQVDPMAQFVGVYKTQNIAFENKILELFKSAANNNKAQQMAFILIEHICQKLEENKELWCTPDTISSSLKEKPTIAAFAREAIEQYLKTQELQDPLKEKLELIAKKLQPSTNNNLDNFSDASSVGEISNTSSPASSRYSQSPLATRRLR